MKKETESLFTLALDVQKYFRSFYLAGGTALMLQYNHRVSIDLDFFNYKSFSFSHLSTKISKIFPIEGEERLIDNIDFFINEKKVSFVFFPFKNIEPLKNFKGLKLASEYDIFLNKIYYAGRRVDSKDPFDAAFLYRMYKWDKIKIKEDFEKKFPFQSYEIYLGALLHFEDYPELPNWVEHSLMDLL